MAIEPRNQKKHRERKREALRMGLNEELPDLKGNKGRFILSSTLVVCKQNI